MLSEASSNYTISIDLGGTNMRVAAVNDRAEIMRIIQIRTPQGSTDPEDVFNSIVKTVKKLADLIECESIPMIGVGCPGPMLFPEGIVSPVYIPAWRDFPLKKRLSDNFKCPVFVDNDAKAFALGEALFGLGGDCSVVMGVVVSTGVGGGIVFEKKLLHGVSGNAGHIGHMIVDPNGLPCPLFGRGCLTTVSSGRGILRNVKQALANGLESSLIELNDDLLNVELVNREAESGDALCQRILKDAGTGLAIAIVSAINLMSPDVVVFGGSVILNSHYLWEAFNQEYLKRQCLGFASKTKILRSELGFRAGILGAAALAFANSEIVIEKT